MGLYSTTLYELIQSVAYSLDDCILSVPSSGTTSTAVSTALIQGDDYYNGYEFHPYLGTHKDQTFVVSDFTASSDTLTLAPTASGAFDTTDYFMLCKQLKYAQYKDAVNRAISMVASEYLTDKVDQTTNHFATDTYEYTIPSGFRYINQIVIEDDVDTGYWYADGVIDRRSWGILHGATPYIKFSDLTYPIDSTKNGLHMRIVGQAHQSTLATDAATTPIPKEFIIMMARAICLENLGKYQEAQYARKTAMDERQRMITPPYQGSRSVFET